MKKKLVIVAVLASFIFSTTYTLAGQKCKDRDTDTNNQIDLGDTEICCCRQIAPDSNQHECEPVTVASTDDKCPPEREIKLSMKIAGKRIGVCEYTKKQ